MRQVLFGIPLDQPWSLGPLGEVPGFGFGVVLAAWILFGLWWAFWNRDRLGLKSEFLVPAALWAGVAVLIVAAPRLARRESDRAVTFHTQAIEHLGSSPRAAEHYVERGRERLSRRDYAGAIADYRAAIEVRPDFAPAYQQLAWTLATSPEEEYRDGTEALELAERAAALSASPTAADLDALAAALAETGHFEEAAARAKEAARLALESRDPEQRGRLSGIRRRLWTYTQGAAWHEPAPARSLPLYGYGLMLSLGFFAAGWDAVRRAGRVGIPAQTIWDFAMVMLVAGVVGARLFYVVQYHAQVFKGADTLGQKFVAVVSLPDGGLVQLGGILLAVVVAWVFCGLRKIPRHLMGDVVMPSLVLGIALGRLGCLMNGCCWGDACELPWAIRFPVGSVPDSAMVERGLTAPEDPLVLLLHPTQIYSAAGAFLLYLFLATLFWYRRRDGVVLAATMLLYAVGRFLIEFVRSDEALVEMTFRKFLLWGDAVAAVQTPFTISQWISIGLFAGGCVYLASLLWRPTRLTRPASLPRLIAGPRHGAMA